MRLSPTSQVAPKAAGRPKTAAGDGGEDDDQAAGRMAPDARHRRDAAHAGAASHRRVPGRRRQRRSRNQVRRMTRAYCRAKKTL